MVIDSGEKFTQIVPIENLKAQRNAVQTLDIGGDQINHYLVRIFIKFSSFFWNFFEQFLLEFSIIFTIFIYLFQVLFLFFFDIFILCF